MGTGEPTLSGSSFFGVGIYRIENASSASPTIVGPINKDAGGADIFSGRAIGKIVVHPTDPNIIFTGTTFGIGGLGGRISLTQTLPNRGLFRSANAMSGSPTFERLTVIPGDAGKDRDVVEMVMDPADPNRIVLSTTGVPAIGAAPADNGGLFLTTTALQPNPIFSKTLDIPGTTNSATRTGRPLTVAMNWSAFFWGADVLAQAQTIRQSSKVTVKRVPLLTNRSQSEVMLLLGLVMVAPPQDNLVDRSPQSMKRGRPVFRVDKLLFLGAARCLKS